jgi:peptide chain release factor 3
MSSLAAEVARRRTFGIISHPDASKTTLTEKLLLYGGALHVAGAVKSRKAARHAVSDWMALEQERGISITSSVLQFDWSDHRFNLLDTPGHADFSEDTYRVLSAVDSAVMLIDVAKGVEPRTLKLFEVCRLRKLPVMTFVNKMDRPGLEPLELMDQVGKTLKIRTVALNWPIGMGSEFRGVYDRRTRNVHLYERAAQGTDVIPEVVLPLDHPEVATRLGEKLLAELKDEIDLLDAAGDVTPFFFGSAMTNFGVGPILAAIAELAPPPGPRKTVTGSRAPEDPTFSGFVFKIQANMNPKHRDRIAFVRVVSGTFERGMEATVARNSKVLRLSKPHTFMAAERSIVEEAAPGDIVGLFDPGELRIGDTLFVGEPIEFQGIPRFAPEHFARVKLRDPTRRKHLQEGLTQLSQEGAIQLFLREGLGAADPYLGAVGQLQFEVLKYRLEAEYGTRADLEITPYTVARWIAGAPTGLAWLKARSDYLLVSDRDGRPVVLASSPWPLSYALTEAPGLELLDVSPL